MSSSVSTGRSLQTVMELIAQLEEAYAQLPGWARTPQMQRRWIIACLRVIEGSLERKAFDVGYNGRRLRFYHVLIQQLMQVENGGSLPSLFVRTNDELRIRQDDRSRNTLQARAAAVLDCAQGHCRLPRQKSGSKGKWAAKVARAVTEAGLGGGKARPASGKRKADVSPSTVIKWLARCRAGTHPAANFYRVRKHIIESADCWGSDAAGRERLLNEEIIALGDTIFMVFGPDDKRAIQSKSRVSIDRFCLLALGGGSTTKHWEILE